MILWSGLVKYITMYGNKKTLFILKTIQKENISIIYR